jgi:hypothetical protein
MIVMHHDGTWATDGVKMTDAIRAVIECAVQAPYDLYGEQREFYLPRLALAMANLGALCPGPFLSAFETVKDPYGEPIK